MKKNIFTLFLLFGTYFMGLNAQSARSILDKASETFTQSNGITASFSLDTEDTSNKTTYSQDGTAQFKGDKFKLDIPDATTWFDGKTQWVYMKENDEVNISNPTGDELQMISPLVLLNSYKKGFKIKLLGEKMMNNKRIVTIELTPQLANSEIEKIEICIDKQTHMFTQITVSIKSGFKNTVSIKDIKLGQNLSDNTFQFKASEHPNAEIVDLR